MIYKFVNFPIIIEVKSGVLEEFEKVVHQNNLHFANPLIITGKKSGEIINRYQFASEYQHYIIQDGKLEEISYLRKMLVDYQHDAIITCGGGRIIDIGKYLARETLIPVVSVPTLLSNDAIASPISILRINNEYKSVGTTMPIGVIVDIEVIKSSPKKYILAGLGDLISNISASYDWVLAHRDIGEKIDNFSRMLAYMPAINLLNNFEIYSSLKDEKFIEDLAYGLILSGIAMNIAHSSRPASGSEHNISHALDRILGFSRIPHGLQVGFATILTTYLQGQTREHRQILELYEKFKFPKTLKEIGVDRESLREALNIAPTIRDRYTILNKYQPEKIVKIADNLII
ncbi:iron-containing alcohol dehydrogenase family protein [Thermococcus sp. 9N3]|uniref:iron-containing alcohol dehydrogenase family protein n=1 Tax=Thermococcus sp. 9N3 TaxID=163002 RepID=UPI001430D29C|nr:iron-containing alcohol dehydrogenase family protein [Thermococcus sp. 9N3]NJE49411.1 iron-containing alcohol dehydrogenase [Thermococcus sp. 9N3]